MVSLPEPIGGALVLDFVNTRDAWLSEAHKREYLTDYGALVAWAEAAGAVDARGAAALGRTDPATGAAVHERALALRDALFALFAPLALRTDPPGGGPAPPPADAPSAVRGALSAAAPDPAAVAAVNAAWRDLATRPCLDADTLAPGWTDAPDRPLGPVLASAAALLRDGSLDRLRLCPGPDGWCGALFLDRTKNGSRRWCSMAVCGNPAKMRARAARRRAAG